jgi:spore maturation protein B
MTALGTLVVPMLIGTMAVYALARRVDVFAALTDGAMEGLRVIMKILPALIALLTGIYMLRASGALDALVSLCAPVLSLLGIPPETASLIFIRPISGSGALAVGSEIINKYGPDSLVGRTAAVMLGSTETTFYIIAVYFGAAGIRKTRYAIPAALCADLTGFIIASLTARLLY